MAKEFARLSGLLDAYFVGVKGAATVVAQNDDVSSSLNHLVQLFASNGIISVDSNEIAKGHQAIEAFYRNGVLAEEGFWPRPVENSRVVESANAIVVDIFLHSKFRTRLVRDVFRYDEQDRIIRMEVTTMTDHRAIP
mmetsp:Transcript_13031/g.17441  ORF Transcript_13031/g.17441 Transcript_13031/m.17441 type:complete len:137 (-) Transcript_13031:170-580(-)